MPGADPFAVIETETPKIAHGDILDIVLEQYGLAVTLEPLLGERDQNLRMQCEDGRRFVLKIANPAEDPLATSFQIEALLHLEAYASVHDFPVNVPRILRTLDGRPSIRISAAGRAHIARVLTFLPGRPLGRTPAAPLLCQRLGASLAHLGRALRDFGHAGSDHGLLWDMQRAPEIRQVLNHVADPEQRRAVADALDDFEMHALPRFPELRAQVIHSDLNPENVLIETDDADRVAGIIDFGDMVKAPLIVDVAVGASYLREIEGNPFSQIAEFLSGYNAVTPLGMAEIDILFDLIKTRLAATVTILSWRATMRGTDDPYLEGTVASEASAARFLKILLEVPREHARQTFRQICASAGLKGSANRG